MNITLCDNVRLTLNPIAADLSECFLNRQGRQQMTVDADHHISLNASTSTASTSHEKAESIDMQVQQQQHHDASQ
jgi:hypothetical protein